MRATILLMLALVSAPALACPPMKIRKPVDPVVALMERVEDSSITNDEIAEIVKSATWIARQRSRAPEQRARALALAAAWTIDERAAKSMLERAFTLDRAAARGVALAQGAEALVETVEANEKNRKPAENESAATLAVAD